MSAEYTRNGCRLELVLLSLRLHNAELYILTLNEILILLIFSMNG
jgi:hypothetical protein